MPCKVFCIPTIQQNTKQTVKSFSCSLLAAMHVMNIVSALFLLLGAVSRAAPTDQVSDLTVHLRGKDGGFRPSDDMTRLVKSRVGDSSFPNYQLSARQAQGAFANISACDNLACNQNCRPIYTGYFQQSQPCISLPGINCIIISNLSAANVQYWSGNQCSGSHTSFGLCQNLVDPFRDPAPNTNSLAVQVGCL